MNLRGIAVCVDYSDLLARSLDRWHTGLDRLIVITSPRDRETQELCCKHNVETHVTDIFYANGARFNKGAAMSEAVIAKGLRRGADWLMTFDADIVPPENWRILLERACPRPGTLYGAPRYQQPEGALRLTVEPARKMPQGWVLGFFMVFHSSDPALPPGALFDAHWPHAGNYDTIFCRRWPHQNQIILPQIQMIHLGEERQNWMGRNNREELRQVLGRRNGWEDWQRERMANPPTLEGA